MSCSVDTTLTQGGFLTQQNAGPGTALLSLGTDSADKITTILKKLDANVNGGIFSNTFIDNSQAQSKANLVSTWIRPTCPGSTGCPVPLPPGWHPQSWVIARKNVGTSTSCTNVLATNNTPSSKAGDQVVINCQFGTAADVRGMDPGTLVKGTSYNLVDPGSAARPNAAVSTCTLTNGVNTVTVGPASWGWTTLSAAFPGQITTAQAACAGNAPQLVVFKPAIYYLDFAWTVPITNILAGTPGTLPAGEANLAAWITDYFAGKWADANGNTPLAYSPCVDPLAGSPTSGVEFFMTGNGAINVNVGSSASYPQLAMCASLAPQGPPILIYSPRGTVGSTGGAIVTGNTPSTLIHLGGTIYAPSRPLNLVLNNAARSSFSYGLFAKSISVTTTGSVSAGGAPLNLAGGIPQGGGSPVPLDFLVLKAYVCPSQATCSTSGTPNLTAKVAITGYINRSVQVISWAPSR